jgi:hypothetical protein
MTLKNITDIKEFKNDFFKQFEKLSKENIRLFKLIYETCSKTNVYIIGGFLRSVVNHENPRDIDVMFNTGNNFIESLIKEYDLTFSKNKLGGYKILLNSIVVDIWTVESNWAFKYNLLKGENDEKIIKRIADGTFFNYDSLVFDLYTKKLSVANYNNCVLKNELDILRKTSKYKYNNPGKINNVLRAFYIRNKTGLEFSYNLCEYSVVEIQRLGLIEKKATLDSLKKIASSSSRFSNLLEEDKLDTLLDYLFNKFKSYGQEKQLKLF